MICAGMWRCVRIIALVAVASVTCAAVPRAASSGAMPASEKIASVKFILHGLSVQPPNRKIQKGAVRMSLYNKYLLRTSAQQRASIGFKDGTLLHMNQRTDAVLQSPTLTYVSKGQVDEILRPGTNHKVKTATAVATAIGTNWLVQVVKVKKKPATRFIVVRGAIKVTNALGSVVVKTNQESDDLTNQAPQTPRPVDAGAAAKWTNGMRPAKLGENVALDANGGHVVAFSSQYSSANAGNFWQAAYINDGTLDYGWESGSGQTTNQWVKIELAGNTAQRIGEIIVDPAATHGDPSSADLKDFQIRVSTTGSSDADFSTVLTGVCKQQDTLQHFPLTAPVSAKYVEILAADNYGSADWTASAELEVVSAP